jgi:hypothetical protein
MKNSELSEDPKVPSGVIHESFVFHEGLVQPPSGAKTFFRFSGKRHGFMAFISTQAILALAVTRSSPF